MIPHAMLKMELAGYLGRLAVEPVAAGVAKRVLSISRYQKSGVCATLWEAVQELDLMPTDEEWETLRELANVNWPGYVHLTREIRAEILELANVSDDNFEYGWRQ